MKVSVYEGRTAVRSGWISSAWRLVLISDFMQDPWCRSVTSLTGAEPNGECVLTRQRQSLTLTQMPRAGKAVKERNYTNACDKERKNRPQMPVAKKERTDHKCWWQTKNGSPKQASKQLTLSERNKTGESTWTTQTVACLCLVSAHSP